MSLIHLIAIYISLINLLLNMQKQALNLTKSVIYY